MKRLLGLFTVILFLFGVLGIANAIPSYYPDVNKTFNDDTLMCWAAAAANTLVWTGWGIGSEYDVMQEFKDNYDDRVGVSYNAWKDYFSWHYPSLSLPYSRSRPFVATLANEWLSQGYGVTFDYSYPGGAHALTLYGMDIDPYTGVGLRVYYANSDDGITGINTQDIFFDGVDRYYWNMIDGYPMGALWALAPVSETTNPIPEPTALFLLGSGLVGLAEFRRKKLKK